RDVRQAYAYLILPRGQPITDSAVKRLAALEEFTELGMGFSVAMRDMEIRGTGNLLGAEQHGAIADIGFEMYCKLLEEAVMELRGEPGAEPPYPTEVKWPADQWFSEDYIPIEAQRIRFYKELAAAREQEQLDYVREELLDRYGALPPEACNLINAFRVKVALARWHVDLVRLGADGEIRISSRQPNPGLGGVLADLGAGERWIRRIVCRNDGGMILYPADDEADPAQTLAALGDFAVALPAPVGCESSL
ncbi:hypothetical protein HY256_09325, partial [Candidatus Sumerlaeota bacterium]|nr:hypothetical protein [Candidatus Sumerlaeota bacterium]